MSVCEHIAIDIALLTLLLETAVLRVWGSGRHNGASDLGPRPARAASRMTADHGESLPADGSGYCVDKTSCPPEVVLRRHLPPASLPRRRNGTCRA